MSEKKNNNTKPTPRRNLGRMTEEEYAILQSGGDRLSQDNHKRFHSKNLGRLTDEEYENLPYGNKGFYKQFKK